MKSRLPPRLVRERRDVLLVAFLGEPQPLTPLVKTIRAYHPSLFHNSGDVRWVVRGLRDDGLIETVRIEPPRRINWAGVDVAASSVVHHWRLTIAGEAEVADIATRARAHARQRSSA